MKKAVEKGIMLPTATPGICDDPPNRNASSTKKGRLIFGAAGRHTPLKKLHVFSVLSHMLVDTIRNQLIDFGRYYQD